MIYDVAVIGAGRAGCAAACTLAAAGCETLLVDRSGRRRMGESLVPAARTLLSELGVWEGFLEDAHLPCHGNESLWGSTRAEGTDFIRSPFGHAWHLDGPRFDRRLRAAAEAAGAAVWTETSLAGLQAEGSGWLISLARPHERRQDVRARFVIDATGRPHRVARRLAVRRRYDDRLVAFQARFRAAPGKGSGDEDSLNRVEAVTEGWWYTARVPGGGGRCRAVVLFTDSGTRWVREAVTAANFLSLLAAAPAMRDRLAEHGYELVAGPEATDARSSRLERMHGEDWLAIGDAAMAFDPLSSQGIFTALYGGVQGARAVLAHLGGDRGALPMLEDELTGVYGHFQSNREHVYRMERRWPESPFWAPRLGVAAG